MLLLRYFQEIHSLMQIIPNSTIIVSSSSPKMAQKTAKSRNVKCKTRRHTRGISLLKWSIL